MKHIFISLLGLAVWSVSFISPASAAEYAPEIDPARFTTTIDNPYFTLTPGTTFSYTNTTDEGTETQVLVVTNLTREVMNVTTLVVWDRVWLNDSLIEETYDWYAQDDAGAVWYFGEDSREYKDGKVKNSKGSWEAGVDGALPGVIMPADPQVGDSYRQEFYAGIAEDMAEVVALGESVTTPYGTFSGCLKTKDTTPLEPKVLEHKYYCPEVGNFALEESGGEKNKLVDLQVTSNQTRVDDWLVAGTAGLLGLLLGVLVGKLNHFPSRVSKG